MTAHRIRLFHSISEADSYHDWLETWLTNMSPWDYPDVDNTVPELQTDMDGNEYYATELAFDWSHDKAILLDNLSGYADSYCSWNRIGYHVCDHDEDSPTACSWEEIRENGTVPNYVPTLN